MVLEFLSNIRFNKFNLFSTSCSTCSQPQSYAAARLLAPGEGPLVETLVRLWAKSKVRGGLDVLKVISLSADFLAAQRKMLEIFDVYRSGFVRLFDTLTEPPAALQDRTSLLNNTRSAIKPLSPLPPCHTQKRLVYVCVLRFFLL